MKPSSGLVLPWFLLISVIAFGLETMAEATQQTGGTVEVNRGSKREWPEVVGLAVEEAEQKIKEDMPMAVLQMARFRNAIVASGLIAFAAAGLAFPFLLASSKNKPVIDPTKPLPPQATFRGPYINTGSRDIGPDNGSDSERKS